MSAPLKRHRLGLRARLTLVVVLGVALVMGYLGWLAHLGGSRALTEARQEQIEALAEAQAAELDRRLAKAAALPQSLAAALGLKDLWTEDELAQLLGSLLEGEPSVYGMAVALAPGMAPDGRRLMAPYLYRSPQGLKRAALDQSDYNYPQQDWFLIPALTGRAMWSEPYFDEGGGDVFMTTFSAPVFKQGRLWAVATADVRLDDLEQLVDELPHAQGGRGILLTRQGMFLASKDRQWSGIFSLAEGLDRADLRALGQVMIAGRAGLDRLADWTDGQPAWVAYTPVRGPGWSYAVVLSQALALEPIARLARQQGLLALAGLLLLGLVVWVMVVRVTRPLKRVAAAAEGLAAGDFGTQVQGVRPGDEVGDLAAGFNRMVQELDQRIQELTTATAARERIESELDLARQIQLSILPRTYPPFPDRPEFDLFARTLPAREVGGDFYDFFLLDSDHLALVVGDVSGKGVPAALFMTVSRTLIKNAAFHHRQPSRVLAEANAQLAPDNELCLFVTVFYGLYQISTGRLRYACAGHPSPLWRMAEGQAAPLPPSPGIALGVVDQWQGQEQEVTMEPGQALLAYTDGLDEAENLAEEPLGLNRVREWLAGDGIGSAPDFLQDVIRRWGDYTEGREQFDDLTLLFFQRRQ